MNKTEHPFNLSFITDAPKQKNNNNKRTHFALSTLSIGGQGTEGREDERPCIFLGFLRQLLLSFPPMRWWLHTHSSEKTENKGIIFKKFKFKFHLLLQPQEHVHTSH